MVNDLKQLLRDNVADAPPDHVDLASLVTAGRRRTRARRTALVGGTAVLAAGAVAASLAVGGLGGSNAVDPARPPAPHAPTLRLADAQRAVEGRDYDELATYTIDDLSRGIKQEIEGVTDDGKLLFRDDTRDRRYALVDPVTDEKDWLPKLDIGQTQTWPIELGADQLVFLGSDGGLRGDVTAYVFDRDAREWSGMKWPTLPAIDAGRGVLGPDGRIYVPVPATQGADSKDNTFDLWSVSLTDMDDVRDERLRLGDYAFTDSSMVWTDGAAGMVHVRELATGEEHSFDPDAGEKCDLVTFGATDDRVVLGEYCGTYADGVRDDRVQILTTDGDQVATLQDSEASGWLPTGSDVVNVTVFGDAEDDRTGTYVYDLETDRFLRISDTISSSGLAGTTGHAGQFQWHTPVDDGLGAKQWVGELR